MSSRRRTSRASSAAFVEKMFGIKTESASVNDLAKLWLMVEDNKELVKKIFGSKTELAGVDDRAKLVKKMFVGKKPSFPSAGSLTIKS